MQRKFLLFCLLSYFFSLHSEGQNVTFNASANRNSTTANVHLCLRTKDANDNKVSVKFYGRKKSIASSTALDEAIATTGKFTIILLPDTQYYTAEPQGTN